MQGIPCQERPSKPVGGSGFGFQKDLAPIAGEFCFPPPSGIRLIHYSGKEITTRQTNPNPGENHLRAGITITDHARTPEEDAVGAGKTKINRAHGIRFPSRTNHMPKGDKSSYTKKQKRQASHIEKGYEKRGVGKKEAEERAWRTVNKKTGGGKKKARSRK